MKKDIHPKYQTITFSCACGAKYLAGSTIEKEFKTEICSNCHPFFTGTQKLIDTSGRVEKFMAKRKAAVDKAEKVKEESAKTKAEKKTRAKVAKAKKEPKAKVEKAPAVKKTRAKKATKAKENLEIAF